MTENPSQTPDSADDTEGDEVPVDPVTGWRTRWMPTPKWVVARLTAYGGLLTLYVTTGVWSREMSATAVLLAVEALTAYVAPRKAVS